VLEDDSQLVEIAQQTEPSQVLERRLSEEVTPAMTVEVLLTSDELEQTEKQKTNDHVNVESPLRQPTVPPMIEEEVETTKDYTANQGEVASVPVEVGKNAGMEWWKVSENMQVQAYMWQSSKQFERGMCFCTLWRLLCKYTQICWKKEGKKR
jgi:hypothetical protein